jgi:hypothetical protein
LGLSLFNKSDSPEVAATDETIVCYNRERRLKMMRQGIMTQARLLEEQFAGEKHWVLMNTLTYAPGKAWQSDHISTFTDRLRKWAVRRGVTIGYTWALELTKRGIPHYHVLVWVKNYYKLPMADKAGWWTHGMTRVEVARCAVGYIAKYASKGFDGELPRGARLHGHGGLDSVRKLEKRWWMLPSYARNRYTPDDNVIRCAGGGFVSRQTGEWIASEWLLCSVGSGYVRLRRRMPPELPPTLA